MNNTFGFSQGAFIANGKEIQFAHISVPGCGRKEKDDAPVILVEIDRASGEIKLEIYADIKSSDPTHEIPLGGAKLELKEPADGDK